MIPARNALTVAALTAAALGLAIAGGSGPAAQKPATPATATALTGPDLLLGKAFSQPVITSDFPDPFILRTPNAYFAFSTNSGGQNAPVSRSTNLVNWQFVGDALPVLAEWINTLNASIWAPESIQVKGGYAMYYSGRWSKNGLMCIGAAFASKPEGPYFDQSSEPFICQEDQGGDIDASPFIDRDGQRYLYWKNDGNCCGMATWIWVQKLSADGRRLEGERRQLIYNSAAWESNLIEAPNVVLRDGRYYLFYSSGRWDSPWYSVGYAVANNPMGPFRKVTVEGALVESTDVIAGPGGQGIVTDGANKNWFYYHAWESDNTTYPAGRRAMYMTPIDWVGGRAVVGFTGARQAAPTPLGAR
ncbi:MAG TPA: glycoside hydrolase family 43 protein [Deinococcales bacterium]|nr:glycoside hydrolase family 43 protein [Deinococcales bacterium]